MPENGEVSSLEASSIVLCRVLSCEDEVLDEPELLELLGGPPVISSC
jgi:hypothetical protein